MTVDPAGPGAARPGNVASAVRLMWQVPDPASFAVDLERRLGLQVAIGREPGGTVRVPLDGSVLEIVPWPRSTPGTEPSPGGRLVLEPLAPGSDPRESTPRTAPPTAPPAGRADPTDRSEPRSSVPVVTLVAIGWGTVDLERAAHELAPWLFGDPVAGTSRAVGRPTSEDPHLGARALIRATHGLPGEAIVLLEPATEGRLAASLARHGEGPIALYLRPRAGLDAWLAAARTRQVMVSSRRDGPLGPQVLVSPAGAPGHGSGVAAAGGAAGNVAFVGPHLIVVGGGSASSGWRRTGNIAL